MSEKKSCRDEEGILKKTSCYTRHALTRVKHGLERISDISHKQSGEHRVAWGVFVFALIGLGVVGGTFLFIQGVSGNPTAANVSINAMQKWTNGDGTAIPSGTTNAVLVGNLHVEIGYPDCVVGESGSATITVIAGQPITYNGIIPFYIIESWLTVYQGATQKFRVPLVQTSGFTTAEKSAWWWDWATKMQNTEYIDIVNRNYKKAVPLATMYAASWYKGDFDTRNLAPNTIYTFYVETVWKLIGTYTYPGGTTLNIPSVPSIDGKSEAKGTKDRIFLSGLGLGEEPEPNVFSVSILANATNGKTPLTVKFDSIVSNGQQPYAYTWNFGDGSYSSEANPIHTFNSTSVVQLTTIDALGNVASSNKIAILPAGAELALPVVFIAIVIIGVAVVVLRRRSS